MRQTRSSSTRGGLGRILWIGLAAWIPPAAPLYPQDFPSEIDLAGAPGTEGARVLRVEPEEDFRDLGSARSGIAFGDLNGDAYDDLIFSGGELDPGAPPEAASMDIHVVFGRPSPPAGTLIDLGDPPAAGDRLKIRLGPEDHWLYGSIACGDLNGDRFDDLILGFPVLDQPGPGAAASAGTIFVLFGGEELANLEAADFADLRTQGSVYALYGAQHDGLGLSVAAGDFNGDGFDDLYAGAPRSPDPGPALGRAYIVYGSEQMPGGTLDISDAPDMPIPGVTLVRSLAAYSQFAVSLAAGDVNGDGIEDLIAGANLIGRAFVIFGGTGMENTIISLLAFDFPQPSEMRIAEDADGPANFANTIDSADLDADGLDDIIAGTLTQNGAAGAVYTVFGSASHPGTLVNIAAGFSEYDGTVVTEDPLLGLFGEKMASADLNGDGPSDMLLSAYSEAPGSPASRVNLVHGGPYLIDAAIDLSLAGPDATIIGPLPGDAFGWQLAAGGDFDRDGFPDLAASSSVSQGGLDRGILALIFGSGSAADARVREYFQPGAAPRRGFGGRHSPVARTWISFEGGAGPGDAPSETEVEVRRSKDGLENFGPLEFAANVQWRVETDRENFGEAMIVLEYTDAEIAGLSEGDLRLYRSPSLTGPWDPVGDQSFDHARNRVSGMVREFSHFALSAAPAGAAPWSTYE